MIDHVLMALVDCILKGDASLKWGQGCRWEKAISYGSGSTKIITKTSNGEIHNITLKDILYAPYTVSNAIENACEMSFKDGRCSLAFNGIICLEALKENNLYEIQ